VSGIVGIIGLEGAPVDRNFLHRLTTSLRFRGPDADNLWISNSVGFGHTLLRATFEASNEKQPCTIDGDAWIVADARVDDRADLIRKLKVRDRRIPLDVTDPELILHAYAVWGRDCVAHLIGDFVFTIWDQNLKRLFCVRDHFGAKPFYYAITDSYLVFSNTLNCLRLHPDISDQLNERAIGDFLLFGYNQDQATTTFADIRRLPGGHTLTYSGSELQISRYWKARTDGCIRYKQPGEYAEHFRALFRFAVADRLRTSRVSVLMSGGLDSTSITAIARELLSERGADFKLGAFTTVYDRLIPDQERRFAKLLADWLGIPVDFTVADDYALYEASERPAADRPEPVYEPGLNFFADQLKRLSAEYRVVLTGWDGDAFLNEPASQHFARLIGSGNLARWLFDVSAYIRSLGRRPQFGLRTALARAVGRVPDTQITCPRWLSPAFASRIDANARLAELGQSPSSTHPLRPLAHGALSLPVWSQIFEFYDAGATGLPLEARHPFMDLRLVDFLLSIPSVPFCMDKHLLRQAMQDRLPEVIRRRPKSTLAGDPVLQQLRNGQGARLSNYRPSPAMSHFIHAEGIFDHVGEMDSEEAEAALRVISLDRWLNRLKLFKESFQPEVSHEHR